MNDEDAPPGEDAPELQQYVPKDASDSSELRDSGEPVTAPPRATKHPEPVDMLRLLYNTNPFYFISALLVLAGIRLAYGEVPVGLLNCWGMLAALGTYTLVMATAGVAVIRLGHVWDDARSILITLVLLFVAMSVSFDELLVIAPEHALSLTLTGWTFAILVTEAVLALTRIRLNAEYRVPYHAALALLFWFPYFGSPELTEFTRDQTEWRLLAFPWLVAAVALSLLPAVWRGRESARNNSTPWTWPVFPWALFVFLGVVCVLRSYVLVFSFGPTDGFETSFGPLHVLPTLTALGVLLLEAGRRHQRVAVTYLGITLPVVAAALTFIDLSGRPAALLVDQLFRERIALPSTFGCAIVVAVALWAMVRRVAYAEIWVAAGIFAGFLSQGVTSSPATLTGAMVGCGLIYFAIGYVTRSAARMTIGSTLLAAAWLRAPELGPFDNLRVAAVFHTALLGLMVIGPRRGGRVGRWIINGVVVLFLAAGMAAFLGYDGRGKMTPDWTLSYLGSLACVAWGYGRLIADRRFRHVTWTLAALFIGRMSIAGLAAIAKRIGIRATAAILGGIGSLALAGLISYLKSRGGGTLPGVGSSTPSPPSSVEGATSPVDRRDVNYSVAVAAAD